MFVSSTIKGVSFKVIRVLLFHWYFSISNTQKQVVFHILILHCEIQIEASDLKNGAAYWKRLGTKLRFSLHKVRDIAYLISFIVIKKNVRLAVWDADVIAKAERNAWKVCVCRCKKGILYITTTKDTVSPKMPLWPKTLNQFLFLFVFQNYVN